MEYEEWIRAQYRQGLSAEAIAQESLRGPVNSLISNNRVESIFGQVAALLGVAPDAIYVVGSSRFGFSLRDGTRFDSVYSDLDLEPVQSLPEISDHMEMRARYPSDISREQFEQIRALLEGARKK
ncbi:hypothetical protein LYZ91_16815, partial [Xanthomonas hortorum pv. vitians]|nr:hypothetical protein [Xanthomonas hortorum pv. vitians]MCE4368250.1 hypothetical protein [Xanthomonas hortorum pv. vitians]